MNKELDLDFVSIYTKDDVKDAMDLIGKDVYMSDSLDFRQYYKNRLIGVRFIEDDPFAFVGSGYETYKYFILAKDIKFKKEKEKLRPFNSMREFFDTTGFDIGNVVEIKRLGDYTYEETSIFNGFRVNINEESHSISVIFGSCSHPFEELFRNFRFLKNNKWLPFGVEE